MKTLLAICMMVFASFVWAGDMPASNSHSAGITGKVLEVINVKNFTYLRLQTRQSETWAAVISASTKKGEIVTIENAIVMKNFESKSLNKTFPSILFGSLASLSGKAEAQPKQHALEMISPLIPNKLEVGDEHITKASGKNARTVAEVVSMGAKLKGKTVLLHGKVVKYNAKIMGKNWLHLRDGSGKAADGTNDILVTSESEVSVGDVVTIQGVVNTDQDFGAGYDYNVLIEEAKVQ